MMTPLELVLSRLPGAKRTRRGWLALCPAHPDRKHPNLSLREGSNGCALLKCWAGCTLDEILRAMGLTRRDLFPRDGTSGQPPRPRTPGSALDEARTAVLREALGQAWARPGVLELYAGADLVRACRLRIDRVRRAATAAGPSDLAAALELLASAADEERRMHALEAALDELVAIL